MALASELIEYYKNLLIIQYRGLAKASATIGAVVGPFVMPQASIQVFRFAAVPTAGSFHLVFNGGPFIVVQWNDTASIIQTNLRAVAGLGEVEVTGDFSVGLTFTLIGVLNPNELLTYSNNTLAIASAGGIVITNIEAKTLPLSVQDAFNVTPVTVGVDPFTLPMNHITHIPTFPLRYILATAGAMVAADIIIDTSFYNAGDRVYVLNPFVGKVVNTYASTLGFIAAVFTGSAYITINDPSNPSGFSVAITTDQPPQETIAAAVGVQLDTLGKYAGVKRTGVGFMNNAITLSDNDFRTLILMATLLNSAGSSLADIQNIIFPFFGNAMQVFDYQNMQMSYVISSGMVSFDLVQMFVTEHLLPKPMAVALSVVYPTSVILFAFRTYAHNNPSAYPFNSYGSYATNHPWVSYANALVV